MFRVLTLVRPCIPSSILSVLILVASILIASSSRGPFRFENGASEQWKLVFKCLSRLYLSLYSTYLPHIEHVKSIEEFMEKQLQAGSEFDCLKCWNLLRVEAAFLSAIFQKILLFVKCDLIHIKSHLNRYYGSHISLTSPLHTFVEASLKPKNIIRCQIESPPAQSYAAPKLASLPKIGIGSALIGLIS